MIRIQTPYFKVCQHCHLHGNIIFPDGSSSKGIILKEIGIEIIKDAFEKGKIVGSEASMLTDQINKSELFSLEKIVGEINRTRRALTEAEDKIKEIGCEVFKGNIMN